MALTDRHLLGAVRWCLIGFVLFLGLFLYANDACAQTSLRGPETALVVGNGLDMVSTEIVLSRAGFKEANPILGQSRTQRLILKSAGTVAQVWLIRTLGKDKPRLAKWLGYGIGAALTGVAASNFSRLP